MNYTILGILILLTGVLGVFLNEHRWGKIQLVIRDRPLSYHFISGINGTLFFLGFFFIVTIDPGFTRTHLLAASSFGMGLCFVGPVAMIWLLRESWEANEKERDDASE